MKELGIGLVMLLIGMVIGIKLGEIKIKSDWEKVCIKKELAEYNRTNGQWQWIGDLK